MLRLTPDTRDLNAGNNDKSTGKSAEGSSVDSRKPSLELSGNVSGEKELNKAGLAARLGPVRIDEVGAGKSLAEIEHMKVSVFEPALFLAGEDGREMRNFLLEKATNNARKLTSLSEKGSIGALPERVAQYKGVVKDMRNHEISLHELLNGYRREAITGQVSKIKGVHLFGRLLMDAKDEKGNDIPYENLAREQQEVVDLGQFFVLEAERVLAEAQLQSGRAVSNEAWARKACVNYKRYATSESLPEKYRALFKKTAHKLEDAYPALKVEGQSRSQERADLRLRADENLEPGDEAVEAQSVEAQGLTTEPTDQQDTQLSDETLQALVNDRHVGDFLNKKEIHLEYAQMLINDSNLEVTGLGSAVQKVMYKIVKAFNRSAANIRIFGTKGFFRGLWRPAKADEMMAEVRRRAAQQINDNAVRQQLEAATAVEKERFYPVRRFFGARKWRERDGRKLERREQKRLARAEAEHDAFLKEYQSESGSDEQIGEPLLTPSPEENQEMQATLLGRQIAEVTESIRLWRAEYPTRSYDAWRSANSGQYARLANALRQLPLGDADANDRLTVRKVWDSQKTNDASGNDGSQSSAAA